MSDAEQYRFDAPSGGPTDEIRLDQLPSPTDLAMNAGRSTTNSALDALREEVHRDVTPKTVDLKVPGRPAWAVRYRCDVDANDLGRWQKAAPDKSQPDGIDAVKVAATILGNHVVALIQDGEVLINDDTGEEVTFRSKEFLESFGVGRITEAVKRWYVTDGNLLAASTEVLTESGYGEDAIHEDPTVRS